MEQLTFTDEDVKFLDEFGAALSTHVQLNGMSMKDVIQFHAHLVKYNQLRKKVNDHVLEIGRILPMPAEQEAPKVSKRGK